VPPVERRHLDDAKSFRDRHHRGVNRPEREVSVSPYELGDALPVSWKHGFNDERPSRQIGEKPDLRCASQARPDEVRNLSDHELRDDQRARMGLHEPRTGRMVAVANVY